MLQPSFMQILLYKNTHYSVIYNHKKFKAALMPNVKGLVTIMGHILL